MRKVAAVGLLLMSAASAHVISMSSGEVTVTGNRVEYLLRMPDYEVAHLQYPERSLLDHITFTSNGEKGHRLSQTCRHDEASVNLICAATYEFPRQVENLTVECSFFDVTVATHIHVLHAARDGKSDRAILDSGFSSATLTFRPPTRLEVHSEQFMAGAMRLASNWAQVLLLAALAVAARRRSELALTFGLFLFAQVITIASLSNFARQPSPRFAEQATAIALAYLGFEIFWFPDSGGRWLIAPIFGAFSGLYFSTFLTEARYPATWVLCGSTVAAILLVICLAAGARAILKIAPPRSAAVALFAAGCAWFAIRLAG